MEALVHLHLVIKVDKMYQVNLLLAANPIISVDKLVEAAMAVDNVCIIL